MEKNLPPQAVAGGRPTKTAGLVLALACALVFLLPSTALAYTFGPTMRATGPESLAFDWSAGRCEDQNIPDSPARAFRDAWGRTQLLVTHWVNYRMIGRDLDHMRLDCHRTVVPPLDPDPSHFAFKEWVSSPYTTDGRTVYALMSMEWIGSQIPGQCDTGIYLKCWYNSIALGVSKNGGNDYTHGPPPTQRVASVPYQYFKDNGPYGVFEPGNIVRKDGWYYAFVKLENYLAQHDGSCLMRTRDLSDPTSWRAWKNGSFSMRWKNPYVVVAMERAEPYTCDPVAYASIATMSGSLTYNTHLGKWLLIGPAGKWDPVQKRTVDGFYYSTSDDLIHWSARELLMETETVWTFQCGDAEEPLGFPSAIDPQSRDRNFGTTGQSFYLYFTRLHRTAPPSCNWLLDRDLVRLPVEFTN